MPAFEFQALDEKGRNKKGVMEGDSPKQIRQKLREKQWIPVSVEAAHESSAQSGESAKQAKGRLSSSELSLLMRQLATLLQAGLTVEQSLKAMTLQESNKKLHSLSLAMRSSIMEGQSFANSMAKFPNAFPNIVVSSVAAGERSGHLNEIMAQLADYAETRQETQSVVKQAMIYPIILLVFSIVIVVAMLVFAMPKIVGFAIDSGATLPTLTQILLNISDFIVAYGVYLLALLLVGVWLFARAMRGEVFRRKWHLLLLKLPLVKRLIIGSDSARLASTLSILGRSNVPMVESLRISSKVMGNQILKEEVETAASLVEKGSGIGFSLSQSGYFPPILLQIISSGEQSGELDSMLEKAADMQDRELRNTISTLLALISPLMLLVLGGLVMVIVLAMMLPMVSVFNQL